MTGEQVLSDPLEGETVQQADVLELSPIIRRVLRPRVHDPEAVEDLVQETLARVIEARPRITGDGLTAYAVVTARNLASSLGRDEARRRDHLHRLVDPRTPTTPEEEALRKEEGQAVSAALARLTPGEKAAIVGRAGGKDTKTVARELGSTPGGVAVQLARARAKLRVDYLLALEKSNPPTPTCRQVLVALSAGDRRRQQALDAGDHLLNCDHCALLSDPVLQRRRPVAAMWPISGLVNLRQLIGERLQSPGSQAAAVGATAAAVAAGVIAASSLGGQGSPPPRTSPPAQPQRILNVSGGPEKTASASGLDRYVGQRVTAKGAVIESVPADEGFWIGTPQDRVFVRLTRPTESGFKARAGQHVSFRGTIVDGGPHSPGEWASTGTRGPPN